MKGHIFTEVIEVVQRDYIATLQQGIDFLSKLSQAQYVAVPEGLISAIGGHVRHIIDHFVALEFASESLVVDYELRQRNSVVERDIKEALMRLESLKVWLAAVPDETFEKTVMVHSNVGIGTDNVMTVTSTFGREVMFACSHAIHHYATMKMIHQGLGGESSEQFGLAPSTASYLRQQDNA